MFNPYVNRKVKTTKSCGVMGSYVIRADTISWLGVVTSCCLDWMPGDLMVTTGLQEITFKYVIHSSNLKLIFFKSPN